MKEWWKMCRNVTWLCFLRRTKKTWGKQGLAINTRRHRKTGKTFQGYLPSAVTDFITLSHAKF
uniref:Uncharacterized protein n=1 Tax=Anguilla anguilla TaxID=7936 RepID=A0A0E9TJT0_ANGAN